MRISFQNPINDAGTVVVAVPTMFYKLVTSTILRPCPFFLT